MIAEESRRTEVGRKQLEGIVVVGLERVDRQDEPSHHKVRDGEEGQ